MEALATLAAGVLYDSYRNSFADHVDLFLDATIKVLADYPPDCVRYVTDSRTGIQSAHYVWTDPRTGREERGKFAGFPPNSGEVGIACEKYMGPIRWREERERRVAQQLAEQAAYEAAQAQRPPPEERARQVARALERRAPVPEALAAIDDRALAISHAIRLALLRLVEARAAHPGTPGSG
jgi:hypothetical protein